LPAHGVETDRDLADLVAGRDVDLVGEVAAGEALGAALDLAHAPEMLARHEQAEQRHQQRDDQGAQNDAPGHGVQGVVDLGERQRGADHRGHLVSAVEDRDGHVEHADLEGLAEPFRVAGGTVQGGLHLGTRRRVVVLHSRRVGFGIGQHVAFDADAAVRPRDHREPGVGGGPEGLDQRLELDGAVEQRRDLAADQLGARLQVVDGLLVVEVRSGATASQPTTPAHSTTASR